MIFLCLSSSLQLSLVIRLIRAIPIFFAAEFYLFPKHYSLLVCTQTNQELSSLCASDPSPQTTPVLIRVMWRITSAKSFWPGTRIRAPTTPLRPLWCEGRHLFAPVQHCATSTRCTALTTLPELSSVNANLIITAAPYKTLAFSTIYYFYGNQVYNFSMPHRLVQVLGSDVIIFIKKTWQLFSYDPFLCK